VNWVFWAFVGAAAIHVVEEYKYPGGFIELMRRLNPMWAPLVTVKFAAIINALFLLLCVVGALMASKVLLFSLSVAGLLFVNTLSHIMGAVRVKGYAPGVVSAVLLYLPLSSYAYYHFVSSGQLSVQGGIVSGLLGALCNAVPVVYLVLSRAGWRA
jgi:hypothetical protein